MNQAMPVRAIDAVSVDTRPFTFSEIRQARNQRSLAVVATVTAAVSTLVVAAAAIILH